MYGPALFILLFTAVIILCAETWQLVNPVVPKLDIKSIDWSDGEVTKLIVRLLINLLTIPSYFIWIPTAICIVPDPWKVFPLATLLVTLVAIAMPERFIGSRFKRIDAALCIITVGAGTWVTVY